MITPVVAIFTAKSGSEEFVESMFRSVITQTLAEDGCISYQLNRDTENPRRFVWTEEWESNEKLQKHLSAAHITDLFEKIRDHVENPQVLVLTPLAGGAA